MRVVDDPAACPADLKGAAVAIGNFDGVHPGHLAVIGEARFAAVTREVPSGVVTFEPHPRRLLRPNDPPFALTSLATKAALIAASGIDALFAVPFNAALASLSAEDFVEQILVRALGVRHVTIGHDFHFGRGRGGNPDVLIALGQRHGFEVNLVAPVQGDAGLYSSSRIREHLRAGRPEEAVRLLGRPWAIEGVVQHGDKRGRLIDFPTANLDLGDLLEPALGVYAVRCHLPRGETRIGVANIGRRPTFGSDEVKVEAHLFDFEGDLYGQSLSVALVAHLRPERKFDGLDSLKTQIAADARAARDLFADLIHDSMVDASPRRR